LASHLQLIVDLDLHTTPIRGRISTTNHLARPFHGWLELELGWPKLAIPSLERVRGLTTAHGLEEPNIAPWQPDLVEAYIHARGQAHAERELEELERRSRLTGGTWAAATALRCWGLLAPVDRIEPSFLGALRLHATQPLAIDQARTQLRFGERPRRANRRGEARAQLHRVFDAPGRTGAEPWAELVRSKLLAASERRVPRRAGGGRALTAQELRVARAVAEGATNAEVGAHLFISTKTVEKHLTSAYRKLGVRSRTQLAARFSALVGC
jgi:DNA-binding CsgD family transcriptional regulator